MQQMKPMRPAGLPSLILISFLTLALCSCGSKGDKTPEPKPEESKPEAQTPAQREFILANRDLINASAYLITTAERHKLCKSLYTEIRAQAVPIDRKLVAWLAKMDKKYVGEVQNSVKDQLLSKTRVKMQTDHKDIKPTLEQCNEVGKKVLTDNLPPKVRNLFIK